MHLVLLTVTASRVSQDIGEQHVVIRVQMSVKHVQQIQHVQFVNLITGEASVNTAARDVMAILVVNLKGVHLAA